MRQQKTINNTKRDWKLGAGGLLALCLAWGMPAYAQQAALASENVDVQEPPATGKTQVNADTKADTPETAAQDVAPEKWSAHLQSTYVWQRKPAFQAPYSANMSLIPERERSYSLTATASLGYRPWDGGEVYLDIEGAKGIALSHLAGLGGPTNGELAKTAGPTMKWYRARAFLRQTWNQGGEKQAVESEAGQLAGMVDKRRTVLTVGNLAVIDIFDDNIYNHDPRTQFMNWAMMTQGAFDYAADARGYTWGAVLEWFHDDWEVRFGRFIQPKEPNGQPLDYRFFKHYGDQLEVAHAHTIGGQPGKLRGLLFRNHSVMTRYSDALSVAAQTGAVPDLNDARFGVQSKRGFGLNLEQALTDDIGLFARGSWADGKTEIYAFTEVDRSLSGGLLIQGRRWGRPKDTVGVGAVRNFLSGVHRQYLAAGGMGPFIGDGRLNYKPEDIVEMFYSVGLTKKSSVTFDWQHIRNPAYNADRGPVNAFAVRLHAEF